MNYSNVDMKKLYAIGERNVSAYNSDRLLSSSKDGNSATFGDLKRVMCTDLPAALCDDVLVDDGAPDGKVLIPGWYSFYVPISNLPTIRCRVLYAGRWSQLLFSGTLSEYPMWEVPAVLYSEKYRRYWFSYKDVIGSQDFSVAYYYACKTQVKVNLLENSGYVFDKERS
jgi:hypothetical protein